MNTRINVRLAGATALAIALPLLAADRLAVKTGLWENTVTTEITGVALPTEQLQRMPPAQRAQMEQMLRQMGVGAPRTVTEKSCVTEEDLEKNTFRSAMEDASQDCTYKQVTGTAKRQEWTFQCKAEGGTLEGRMEIDVLRDTQVQGRMEARSPQGGMNMKFEARWLSASCAGADAD